MARPRLQPPRPDLVRRPSRSFGWLDARLLHEGWLARLGADAIAVLVLLALAADESSVSFYGRDKMALKLGLRREALDTALTQLLEQGLVAQRPWRPGHVDGVWQVLPLPNPVLPMAAQARGGEPMQLKDVLKGLLGR